MQTGGTEHFQDRLIGGRYRVVAPIGRGGMGAVCLVRDEWLEDEQVALKLVTPTSARSDMFFRRLKNEVILARRLTHPNIVRLYDFGGPENGSFYITMEYVEGMSLREVLLQPPGPGLPLRQAVDLLFHVAVGLDHAHSKNVVHRDLKPDNILLARTGGVRITDFGSARSTELDRAITPQGQLVGTPHYLAPEMFRGDQPDALADVYAFGILAFETLTGRLPFEEHGFLALLGQHLNHPVPSIRRLRAEVPGWMEEVILTCTEKEPRNRFQSMAELAEILFRKLCESSTPPCLPGLPATLQQCRRAGLKKKWGPWKCLTRECKQR